MWMHDNGTLLNSAKMMDCLAGVRIKAVAAGAGHSLTMAKDGKLLSVCFLGSQQSGSGLLLLSR